MMPSQDFTKDWLTRGALLIGWATDSFEDEQPICVVYNYGVWFYLLSFLTWWSQTEHLFDDNNAALKSSNLIFFYQKTCILLKIKHSINQNFVRRKKVCIWYSIKYIQMVFQNVLFDDSYKFLRTMFSTQNSERTENMI